MTMIKHQKYYMYISCTVRVKKNQWKHIVNVDDTFIGMCCFLVHSRLNTECRGLAMWTLILVRYWPTYHSQRFKSFCLWFLHLYTIVDLDYIKRIKIPICIKILKFQNRDINNNEVESTTLFSPLSHWEPVSFWPADWDLSCLRSDTILGHYIFTHVTFYFVLNSFGQ